MKILKTAILASAALTIAALSPASAAGLKPGQYEIAGIQQVCLKKDWTWYYTTFSASPWTGGWANPGDTQAKTIMWGSYDGVGEDSIVISKNGLANWMEFHDDRGDGALVNYFYQTTMTWVKKKCDPMAAGVRPNQPTDPLK